MGIGVFIVDDQEDVRSLMRLVLESAPQNFVVAGAASGGHEALEQLGELEPDIVLLDEMMPGMNGLELASELRRRRPDQVMVMCSAFLDEDLEERARAAGVQRCLSKEELTSIPEVLCELVPC